MCEKPCERQLKFINCIKKKKKKKKRWIIYDNQNILYGLNSGLQKRILLCIDQQKL